ncbi:hypothetical protein CH333_03140 [candidate division WOR-3 bacterium JGI_Cruoil_03_44_89]|uniref:Lipoprotein n=1 Tax=candidate division WOR-3 bacterium JGI_Cruoil_03_44_89 TaxID=1973748 RepID=A0A235BYC1_UNCW3|nr:MAG: hypothetical protein CH333_03140 [candidate division WOR-3 bacterium JGI_Cruoil_03_44_89]
MKRYLFFLYMLLLSIGCAENPLQPPGGIKHGTGSCNLTEGSSLTFTFPGGDYGEFILEYNNGYVYINATGIIRVSGNRDTAPEGQYLTCELFEWVDEESHPYYYFLKTDDAIHYAKVRRIGDITKELTIKFEWWLQIEAGNRYLGSQNPVEM